MKHAEKTIIIGVLVTGWFFLLALAYMMFAPMKVLVVNNYDKQNPLHVNTKVLLPGETLKYHLDYCKYIDIRPTVTRTLVDGQVITLADIPSTNLPKGCGVTLMSDVTIPLTLNPGEYYLDVTAEYNVSLFRTERVQYRTEYFRVGALLESEREVINIDRDGKTIVVPAYPATASTTETPVTNLNVTNNPGTTRSDGSSKKDGTPEPEQAKQERTLLEKLLAAFGL